MNKLRYGRDVRLNDFRGYESYKEKCGYIIEKPENNPGDDAVFIGEPSQFQNTAIPGTHQCGNKCGDGELSSGKEERINILAGPLIKTKPQSSQEVEENDGFICSE